MRLRLGTLALIAAAALVGPALAADHTATLDAGNTTYTWDGAAASSLGDAIGAGAPACGEATLTCEDTLLNIASPGELDVTIESPSGQEGPDCLGSPCASFQDFDGYIYKSNAAGEPQGDALGDEDTDCASSYPSEACKLAVETGFYLIRVQYFATLEGAYKGTVKLTTSAPAAAPTPAGPGTTPPAQPTPQGQPSQPASQPKPSSSSDKAAKKKKLKACQKKAKKKKNKQKRKAALKRCAKKFK